MVGCQVKGDARECYEMDQVERSQSRKDYTEQESKNKKGAGAQSDTPVNLIGLPGYQVRLYNDNRRVL